jgi:hypothetical protein
VLALLITAAILTIFYFLPSDWPKSARLGALVSIPLSLFLFSWVSLPIRFKRNLWIKARFEFEPFRPAREVIPEEFWRYMCETIASLSAYGFTLAGHFQKLDFVAGFNGFTTVMENNEHATLAILSTTYYTKQPKFRGNMSLGFKTESEHGTEIVTVNNTILTDPPYPQTRIVLWMPEVRLPDELFEYHRRLLKGLAVEVKRNVLKGGSSEYMKFHSQALVDHWVKVGYYKLDQAGEAYRLTWKGAILTSWKHLWPIKPLRYAWRKHQTHKLLRKLEE